jgi:SAM-dependent methyltransferase
MYKSPLTGSTNTEIIFEQIEVPIFQNKVYPSQADAIKAQKSTVKLAQCKDTGFVFSAGFDIEKLFYDENYQNEQSNSGYFQQHLTDIINLLEDRNLLDEKILEIGCGKGYFMDMLLDKGKDVIGIDPTYEGNSDKVIKEYYSEKYAYLNAGLIVLRHTLEHIPKPFDFIKMIAKANNYKGKIYIEIPTFDWIVKNNAVEDIFYEHCNYFTPNTISQLFTNCEVNYVFNKQYIGIIAGLDKVKETIEPAANIEQHQLNFEQKFNQYTALVNSCSNTAIWGAGAKGSTFLNLVDPNRDKIKYVIDINPKKQNRFIGGTGHPIQDVNYLEIDKVDNLILMNTNYEQEIAQILKDKNININIKTLQS